MRFSVRSVAVVASSLVLVSTINAQPGVGASVTLWGEGLPADEVAAHAGTVSYELMCAVAPRVPVGEI